MIISYSLSSSMALKDNFKCLDLKFAYLSMLMATRFKMDAVLHITSTAIQKSHNVSLNSQSMFTWRKRIENRSTLKVVFNLLFLVQCFWLNLIKKQYDRVTLLTKVGLIGRLAHISSACASFQHKKPNFQALANVNEYFKADKLPLYGKSEPKKCTFHESQKWIEKSLIKNKRGKQLTGKERFKNMMSCVRSRGAERA